MLTQIDREKIEADRDRCDHILKILDQQASLDKELAQFLGDTSSSTPIPATLAAPSGMNPFPINQGLAIDEIEKFLLTRVGESCMPKEFFEYADMRYTFTGKQLAATSHNGKRWHKT